MFQIFIASFENVRSTHTAIVESNQENNRVSIIRGLLYNMQDDCNEENT